MRNGMLFFLCIGVLLEGYFLSGGRTEKVVQIFLAQASPVVSMTATVLPNPFNTLAEKLQDWKRDLERKEQLISEREAYTKEREQRMMWYALVWGVLLAIFFGIHLYFDARRRR